MDWLTVLVIGLFALAWLFTLSQSRTDDWTLSQTAGMLVFLAGATGGAFYDDVLSADSSLLPWSEPIAAVIMLSGLFIAWVWEPSGDTRLATVR